MDVSKPADLTEKPKKKRKRADAKLIEDAKQAIDPLNSQAIVNGKKPKTRAQKHQNLTTTSAARQTANPSPTTQLQVMPPMQSHVRSQTVNSPLSGSLSSSSLVSSLPTSTEALSHSLGSASSDPSAMSSALTIPTQHIGTGGKGTDIGGKQKNDEVKRESTSDIKTAQVRDLKTGERTGDELETALRDKGQDQEQMELKGEDSREQLAGVAQEENASSSSISSSQISAPTTTQVTEPTSTSSLFDEQKALIAARQEVAAWSAGKLKSNVLAALRGDYLGQHSSETFRKGAKSESRSKAEIAELRAQINRNAHSESQRQYTEMNEKGEAYDLILKRVRDREIDKIMKRKREEHAKQFHTTTAGATEAQALVSTRLTKILEQLKKSAQESTKTPGKKSVDVSLLLHTAGVILHGGLAKGKQLGQDPHVRATFLEMCRGKPAQTSAALPAALPQVDEALWGGDKSAKEHYISNALKRKMLVNAPSFSWNPKDWIISGWPTGVRPLMHPKHYRVPELSALYASLPQITIVSAVLPPKNGGVNVVLSAQQALVSVIDSCGLQLSRMSSHGVPFSSSSSSSQPNTPDILSLDSARLKLISDSLPSLMQMPLDQLQSKLSLFSS